MSKHNAEKLKETIENCREFLADRTKFEQNERTYKLKIAENIGSALQAVRDGSDLNGPLAKAFGSPNNLTSWQAHDRFVRWAAANPDAARHALEPFTHPELSVEERVNQFFDRLPKSVISGFGTRLMLASFFLFGSDPKRLVPYRYTAFELAERLLGCPQSAPDLSPGQTYVHHLAFIRKLEKKLRAAGLDVRDTLDAQGLMWWLTKNRDPVCVMWREGKLNGTDDGKDGPPPDDIATLAAKLLLDEVWLKEVIGLLRDRKQIILYGPPGTGKTYIARQIMWHLAPEDTRHAVVQFHPSYSYEDFVQGYRPITREDGALAYELKHGPLIRLTDAAGEAAEGAEHVLLIDEINRGNLPKILGELLYLLEYRTDAITLMYSEEGVPFSLPENLLIIGTMNTADRSVGLIDAALRRRFHFIPLFPGEPPLDGFLERWFDTNQPEMRWVADVVKRLNAKLRERFGPHLQIGHSYFVRPGLSEEMLERIWRYDVMPFLEDQFFGQEEELEQFSLKALRDEPA